MACCNGDGDRFRGKDAGGDMGGHTKGDAMRGRSDKALEETCVDDGSEARSSALLVNKMFIFRGLCMLCWGLQSIRGIGFGIKTSANTKRSS